MYAPLARPGRSRDHAATIGRRLVPPHHPFVRVRGTPTGARQGRVECGPRRSGGPPNRRAAVRADRCARCTAAVVGAARRLGSSGRSGPSGGQPVRRAAPASTMPAPSPDRREQVGDAAEEDDRQDADRPVDEDDRQGLGRRARCRSGSGRPTTPASTTPIPAGVNGTAVSSEPVSATKNAPLMPSWTSRKPERLDDEVEPQRLGRPDQPGQDHQARQRAQGRSPRRRPPRTGRRARRRGAAAAAGR